MFNQLPATQTIEAIGRAARDAARAEGELGEFDRGQLLSAFSATRHLAVEVTAYEPALLEFARKIGDSPLSCDAAVVGAATCEALEALAAAGDAEGLAELRAALRDLVDREVDLLADAIEGP